MRWIVCEIYPVMNDDDLAENKIVDDEVEVSQILLNEQPYSEI